MAVSQPDLPDSTESDEEFTSVLLGHCVTIYDAMYGVAEQAPQGLVFTGHLVSLFEEVGLGQPYYTAVTRKLKAMDCIRRIQRGGGPKPSKWLLLQRPSEALFGLPDTWQERTSTSHGAKGMAEQQLRDMNTRLLRLEAWARNQGYR